MAVHQRQVGADFADTEVGAINGDFVPLDTLLDPEPSNETFLDLFAGLLAPSKTSTLLAPPSLFGEG